MFDTGANWHQVSNQCDLLKAFFTGKIIGIEIGIEIENNYIAGMVDPDPDPDFDLEKADEHRL